MLPTFIVAGAAKSGTTTVWQHLKAHPQVCMASIKETNFFTREIPAARYDLGLEWYQELFKTCGAAKAIGEVSPAYMARQDTPGLIRQTLPDILLIFIFRDPVERLYSQYWYQRQQGAKLPDFDLLVSERRAQLERYLYNSSYNLHLERYLRCFSREQILVLLNDDLRSDAAVFMKGVYQAIGVDPDFAPANLEDRYNQTGRARIPWVQRRIKAIGPRLMRRDLPGWLFGFLKRSRSIFWRLNTVGDAYPPLAPVIRQTLLPEFSETIDYLEGWLERSLDNWRRVQS